MKMSAVLILYDITNEKSFSYVENVLTQIYRCQRASPGSRTSVLLIGNKSDLERKRKVSYEEGQELARHNGTLFIETSTTHKLNIENILRSVIATQQDS